MGESQPTLEMGPCLARHPQFGADFRNCSNNLLLEHRVGVSSIATLSFAGVTSAVGVQFAIGRLTLRVGLRLWLRQIF